MKKLVHLVDDDDAVRDSLRILLESYGFDVHDYKSATDFLAAAATGATGCLVLDLHLPVLGGLELITLMQQRQMRVPVVFITGRGEREIKERAIKAGATAFLDKPVCEESLVSAIHAALQTREENVSAGSEQQVPLPA